MNKKEIFATAANELAKNKITCFMVADVGEDKCGIAFGGDPEDMFDAITQGLVKMVKTVSDTPPARVAILVHIFKNAITALKDPNIQIMEITPEKPEG